MLSRMASRKRTRASPLERPPKGKITVRSYHRGNHIFIEVEDDGQGIPYEKVRQKAVERGLVSEQSAARLSERELRELLFHPGFSTASMQTELAGPRRGARCRAVECSRPER